MADFNHVCAANVDPDNRRDALSNQHELEFSIAFPCRGKGDRTLSETNESNKRFL